MLKKFMPDQHAKSIFEIKPEDLIEKGVRGVITDLDNTLVEWDRPDATPELTNWFTEMQENGISVLIVSNNNEARVRTFAEPLGVPYIYSARKPMRLSFKKALKKLGMKKEEVVVIGDQLMTDVLGGNLTGVHTILVVPVAQSDGLFTRVNRQFERRILNWMKRKGMIYWEE
ncbi:YqeG family HAD IIIA-type phosphatase [Bacillus solimangrovi]|uniref:YqeG family HAD IIIA-type phosphatase n=1 Tax=Bacillus solimangrovi TaxID=1305675 RepID=A0A1E5LHW2_9BACI|nr:YqeG family HAD IIIA-type phosphatase [Bacillus solimangrovi]OEH93670.1 hypothetical protein BFG57_11555 [Bacillus solimangrovi]